MLKEPQNKVIIQINKRSEQVQNMQLEHAITFIELTFQSECQVWRNCPTHLADCQGLPPADEDQTIMHLMS